MIPDPAREISRRFVVSLWPSTVWIGANMRVEAVSLGLTSMGGYAPGTHNVHVTCNH
jgi:hypothetical protein